MHRRIANKALAFAAGVALLEGAGSILHAVVLRDIPPDLAAKGVTLGWMLRRDVKLGALAGAVFAAASFAPWIHGKSERGFARVVLLGIAFALGLEALNWILPNALLSPSSWGAGLVAWGYFAGAACLAARMAAGRSVVARA